MTTGRIHHLLSNQELWYFYLLDWSEKTIDIREQFPLSELGDAIKIADRLGIRYPYDRKSGFPYVLTSDFLITTRQGTVARSVKLAKDLDNPRVCEKLEIERQYWKNQGVEWRLVTENEISRVKARNIEWLFSGSPLEEVICEDEKRNQSMEYFLSLYEDMSVRFPDMLMEVEQNFGLREGAGICIFKALVRYRKILLEMEKPINLSEPRERDVLWDRNSV
ncbi:MAG: TnsA endonuclease N-terminal domain-containing protein [Butyrivibrio sp.]|nr:TnsA endonuclease N-terminal domain-containing protein [Butyrivibrio sp.]